MMMCVCTLTVTAQDPRYDGHPDLTDALMDAAIKKNPQVLVDFERSEAQLQVAIKNGNSNRGPGAGPILIPVVVHVIHNNGPENISEAQIAGAIDQCNMQLAGGEGGVNTNIQLCLATRNPQGGCTEGIDRTVRNPPVVNPYEDFYGFDDPCAMSDAQLKGNTGWPSANYLNIWIVNGIRSNPGQPCNSPSGIGGYAYYPGGAAGLDGIVIADEFFGASGTGNGNQLNTLAHELGHYLNLMHVWGPDFTGNICITNCHADANCATAGDF